jgi:hypothetical protein
MTISGVAIGMKMNVFVSPCRGTVVQRVRSQPDERAEGRRDERGQRGQRDADDQGLPEPRPGDRVHPGVEAELAPHEVESAGRIVEREDDHHRDRQEQVASASAVKAGTSQHRSPSGSGARPRAGASESSSFGPPYQAAPVNSSVPRRGRR